MIDSNDTYAAHADAEQRYRMLREKEMKEAFKFVNTEVKRDTRSISGSVYTPEYFILDVFKNGIKVMFEPKWNNGSYCGGGYVKVKSSMVNISSIDLQDLIDSEDSVEEFKISLEKLSDKLTNEWGRDSGFELKEDLYETK